MSSSRNAAASYWWCARRRSATSTSRTCSSCRGWARWCFRRCRPSTTGRAPWTTSSTTRSRACSISLDWTRAGRNAGAAKWASARKPTDSVQSLQNLLRFLERAFGVLDFLGRFLGLRCHGPCVPARVVCVGGRAFELLLGALLACVRFLRLRGGLLQFLFGPLGGLARVAKRAFGILHGSLRRGTLLLSFFFPSLLVSRAGGFPGGFARRLLFERDDARRARRTSGVIDARDKGGKRLESRRLHVVCKPARFRRAWQAGVGRERLQRRGHAAHRVGRGGAAGLREKLRRVRRQLGQSGAARFKRGAEIGRFSAQLRRLRLPELFARVQQPIERDSVLQVELVDGPGRDGRFGQPLDAIGGLRMTSLLQPRRERIPRRGEFSQWKLKERVDIVVDALYFSTFPLFHFSTFPLGAQRPDLDCHIPS